MVLTLRMFENDSVKEQQEKQLFYFIQNHCIYRTRSLYGEEPIPSRIDGTFSDHQMFMMRALMNPEMAMIIGRLFWDRMYNRWNRNQFQIAGFDIKGVALVNAITHVATSHGIDCTGFIIRNLPKSYGLMNWTEGMIRPEVPVMLVDDFVNSGQTLDQSQDVFTTLDIPTTQKRFTIVARRRHDNLTTLFMKYEFSVLHGERWDERTYDKQ